MTEPHDNDRLATATAPASSANLGPGFDAVALALELRCRCAAEVAGAWSIEEGGRIYAPGPGDLVVRAVTTAIGDRPIRLRIDNAVPRSRGLGSSSAVAVAAAAAALRAVGEHPDDARLFEIACELEGHPDNAAAAVFGGLVLARGRTVRRLPLSEGLVVVVGIPDVRLSTHKARAALPGAVRHAAAARNVARMGFLVEGLRTGDRQALLAASGDELHEEPRRELSPVTTAMIESAYRAGAHHAAWSGAGPTALAITDGDGVAEVIGALEKVLDGAGEVLVPAVATTGWT
jgi:homoserine kinase